MHYPANNKMSALVELFNMEAHCRYCNRFKPILPEIILRRHEDIDINTLRKRLLCTQCGHKAISILLSYRSIPDNVVLFPDIDNNKPV